MSLDNIFQGIADAIEGSKDNIYQYSPHEKQREFHHAEDQGRLFIGGNRSGKSVAGVTEDLFWILGQHPFRSIPKGPIRGRVVGVDFVNGISQILLPIFKKYIPLSAYKHGTFDQSFDKRERVLEFRNGSFIEFKSYDQELDKFAGTSRHFIHFDEEPPEDIFNECMARLVDTEGSWWMTMTPVEGMTWVYDEIYAPNVKSDK